MYKVCVYSWCLGSVLSLSDWNFKFKPRLQWRNHANKHVLILRAVENTGNRKYCLKNNQKESKYWFQSKIPWGVIFSWKTLIVKTSTDLRLCDGMGVMGSDSAGAVTTLTFDSRHVFCNVSHLIVRHRPPSFGRSWPWPCLAKSSSTASLQATLRRCCRMTKTPCWPSTQTTWTVAQTPTLLEIWVRTSLSACVRFALHSHGLVVPSAEEVGSEVWSLRVYIQKVKGQTSLWRHNVLQQ